MTIARDVVCARRNALAERSIWSRKSDNVKEQGNKTASEEGKKRRKEYFVG
jgi:hypothetical protein